jgi:hypothetical protein
MFLDVSSVAKASFRFVSSLLFFFSLGFIDFFLPFAVSLILTSSSSFFLSYRNQDLKMYCKLLLLVNTS